MSAWDMEHVEKTVFLSYRRTNIPWALAVFQDLTRHGYDVFFDYTGIASSDFERVILGNMTARAHFLVLLTPSALKGCGNPSDWLRREIETALASQRNVVPLMLEGFDFDTPIIASQLTGTLAALRHYNGLSIPSEYFLEAMERLRGRYLNVPVTVVLHPASLSAQRTATEQKAAAEATPAVQKADLTAQQWFERGLAAADVDGQLRFYSEAIRLKPDYAEAFRYRGVVRRTKGDMEGALQDCSGVIRLGPEDAAAFTNRGDMRRAKGDVEGALQDYGEAIRLKPDHAAAWAFMVRGNMRRAKGDVEGALQDYNEAIRLKPDYAEAFNNGRREVEGALRDYSKVEAYVYAAAFYYRADARRHNGDVEGALQDYDEAIRLKPDHAEVFKDRAFTRFACYLDMEGALQDYSEAIRLRPNDAEAFNQRADVRRAKGDVEGALQDYTEAKHLRNRSKK
jgi:tetratricopeptide (TPR) repeat protein